MDLCFTSNKVSRDPKDRPSSGNFCSMLRMTLLFFFVLPPVPRLMFFFVDEESDREDLPFLFPKRNKIDAFEKGSENDSEK